MSNKFSRKFFQGEFAKVLLRFASSQVISNVLRLASGFIVVSLINPEEYGIFTAAGIYLGYLGLGHFGIINGLGREYPYLLGANNKERALELRSTAFLATAVISVLSFLFYLTIASYHFLVGNNELALVLSCYSIIGAFHLLNTQFLPTLYRTNSDFDVLSKINLLTGFLSLFSVVLVWFYDFYGLLLRTSLIALIQFIWLKQKLAIPLKISFNLNFQDLKALLKVGIPIFIVGQIGPLWITISNNVLINNLGTTQFGLFALSTIVLTSFSIIPRSFSQVIYPRMATMYGANNTIVHIVTSNLKVAFFQFFIVLFIAILASLLLPILVTTFLPKYLGGVEAAQWMLFVPVVYSLGVMNNIFNAVKKMKEYTLSLFIGAIMGITYLIVNVFYFENKDLVLFPKGLIIGGAVQQTLSAIFIVRMSRQKR